MPNCRFPKMPVVGTPVQLCNTNLFGVPQVRRPMWVHKPKPYLLGVPKVRRDQCGCRIPAFSGSPSRGEVSVPASPLPPWGLRNGGRSIQVPKKGEKQIYLDNPILIKGEPMVKGHLDGYMNIAFLRSPKLRAIILATCSKRLGMYPFPSGHFFNR